MNPPIRTVVYERNGKTYSGSYTVDGQYLKVDYGMATKTTTIDPFEQSPPAYAKLLLSEMVEAEIKEGSRESTNLT